jgi:hypothetical protein
MYVIKINKVNFYASMITKQLLFQPYKMKLNQIS